MESRAAGALIFNKAACKTNAQKKPCDSLYSRLPQG
jgi:hypothetical protein